MFLIELITESYDYLTNIDISENYQNGLLKVIIRFSEGLTKAFRFKKEKGGMFLEIPH